MYKSHSEDGGNNFFETFLTIHQTTWRHTSAGSDFETHFVKKISVDSETAFVASVAYVGRHALGCGEIRIRGKIILKRIFGRK
jgi:hypothetical protein